MNRRNKTSSLEYFSRMDSSHKNKYILTLKGIEKSLMDLEGKIKNKKEFGLLSSSVKNMISALSVSVEDNLKP